MAQRGAVPLAGAQPLILTRCEPFPCTLCPLPTTTQREWLRQGLWPNPQGLPPPLHPAASHLPCGLLIG